MSKIVLITCLIDLFDLILFTLENVNEIKYTLENL